MAVGNEEGKEWRRGSVKEGEGEAREGKRREE